MRAQDDSTTTSSTVPDSTTSSSTTSSTTTTVATTTTTVPPVTIPALPLPAGYQAVTYRGIRFAVPGDWPVYDLAADRRRCVRADQHAAYLGEPGPTPDCPARVVGRTETVRVESLAQSSQLDTEGATEPVTLNGLTARIDPDPDTPRALTVVLPDQQLVLVISYRDVRTVADTIFGSIALA